MKVLGGNPDAAIAGRDELPGASNYLVGRDARRWRTGVRRYAKVEYHNIYPRIDLVYYGNQRQLEYDFIVRPGGDPAAIQIAFDGTSKIGVDGHGDLLLNAPDGRVVMRKPDMYQQTAAGRRQVSGGYTVDGTRVAFRVGEYDATRPLVIDPVLVYSTYLGGSDADLALGVAVDADGAAYVTGRTLSVDFPVSNPFQPGPTVPLDGVISGEDVFVAKVSPDGTWLMYSTYLGGTGDETGNGIVVDGAGNAHIVGSTRSSDFPTVKAVQGALGGDPECPYCFDLQDAFVATLNADGSAIMYSTYLGGSDGDGGNAIALDGDGALYVTGRTLSANFPTVNALQPEHRGAYDAFVTKLTPDGSAFAYSTYLGGWHSDIGNGIAVDGQGHAAVAGETLSTDFPTRNAFQAVNRGANDAFLAKLYPDGSDFIYATYLGGPGADAATALALYGPFTYVTGWASDRFPVSTALQQRFGGGATDAFVARLDFGGRPIYQSYLGGESDDRGAAVAVGPGGEVFVAGVTVSPDFPARNPLQIQGRQPDAFVTKIDPEGFAFVYSTYVGGTAFEQVDGGELRGPALAVDSRGDAYVAGFTDSADFPTSSDPIQRGPGGYVDGFIAKIFDDGIARADLAVVDALADFDIGEIEAGDDLWYEVVVTNNGAAAAAGVALTVNLPEGTIFKDVIFAFDPTVVLGSCVHENGIVTCTIGPLFELPAGSRMTAFVTVTSTAAGTLVNVANVTSGALDPDPSNNIATTTRVVSAPAPVNHPPIADAGPDQIVVAGADCQGMVTLDGTESTDPDGDALTYTWTAEAFIPWPPVVLSGSPAPGGVVTGPAPTGPLPVGTHRIMLTVDDGRGGTASDTVVITVRDVSAPVFSNVPGPIVVEQTSPQGAVTSLPMPAATDNCSASVAVASDAPAIFPPGVTIVTFTATDASGNRSTASTTVTVVDTTPPVIAAITPTPGVLRPPNHALVPITVDVSVSDVADAAPVCRIVSVDSNEPVDGLGDGDFAPDSIVTGPLTATLRAERAAGGSGRRYSLTVQCTDAAMNSSVALGMVFVPHD